MSQKNSLEMHYYLLSLLAKKKLHFDISSRCAVGRQMSGTLLPSIVRRILQRAVNQTGRPFIWKAKVYLLHVVFYFWRLPIV